MSNHGLIRFIRSVSQFTVHLCNVIFFPTTFNTPCKWFIKFLEFWSLKLNTALVVPIEIKIGIEYMSVSFGFAWTCVAGRAVWAVGWGQAGQKSKRGVGWHGIGSWVFCTRTRWRGNNDFWVWVLAACYARRRLKFLASLSRRNYYSLHSLPMEDYILLGLIS